MIRKILFQKQPFFLHRRYLSFIFLALFLFSQKSLWSQDQDECLSIEQLNQIYSHPVTKIVSSMSEWNWKLGSYLQDYKHDIDGETLYSTLGKWTNNLNPDIYILQYCMGDTPWYVEFVTDANCYISMLAAMDPLQAEHEDDTLYRSQTFQDSTDVVISFLESKKKVGELKIVYYNKSSLDSLVTRVREERVRKEAEIKRREQLFEITIASVEAMEDRREFENAIQHIDSILPSFAGKETPELYKKMGQKKEELLLKNKQKEVEVLLAKGIAQIEQEEFDAARETMDAILKLEASHAEAKQLLATIQNRSNIIALRKDTIYPYEILNATAYQLLYNDLEREINRVVSFSEGGNIMLDYLISFDTLGMNRTIFDLNYMRVPKSKSDTTGQGFENYLLSSSKKLMPTRVDHVLVQSRKAINFELTWKTTMVKVKKKQKDEIYKIKATPKKAFGSYEEEVMNFIKKDKRVVTGNYKLSVKEKSTPDLKYTDVKLEKYKLVGPEAMLYSMLFPGIGTAAATQGQKGWGAFSSFIIFGGAGLACYMLYKKDLLVTQGEDGQVDTKKNDILKYAAFGCAGISGIIYISDVFTALAKGIKNVKQSREIRDALKKEKVTIVDEPVVFSK